MKYNLCFHINSIYAKYASKLRAFPWCQRIQNWIIEKVPERKTEVNKTELNSLYYIQRHNTLDKEHGLTHGVLYCKFIIFYFEDF